MSEHLLGNKAVTFLLETHIVLGICNAAIAK